MSLISFEDSFVNQCFGEFYKEILRQKQKALVQAGKHLPTLTPKAIKNLVISIVSTLENLFKEQEDRALKGGRYTQLNYRTCQYIMVVLTDEIFLNLQWQGQPEWDKNILESRMYNSRKAGEKFFENLKNFLEQNDPLRTDVAAVYLQALAMGFQGKYREEKDTAYLDKYIEQLYEFIYKQPPKVFTQDYHLFPDAYGFTIENAYAQKLPDANRWYYLYFGCVLTFLFVTYIMWFDITFDIRSLAYEIIKLSK